MSFNVVMNVLDKMHEYQTIHDIKDQCIANTQYLYDVIKHNTNLKVKAKAVFVVHDVTICHGHLCLEVDGKIIDPSYQFCKLDGALYTPSFKVLRKVLVLKHGLDLHSHLKPLLETHLKFKKYADDINNGGLLLCCKDYYDAQADYIEGITSPHS